MLVIYGGRSFPNEEKKNRNENNKNVDEKTLEM